MYANKEREMLDNKSICDDKIFAQLTDMFGDTVPTEIILKTGQETKWKCKYIGFISFAIAVGCSLLRFKRQNDLNHYWLLHNRHIIIHHIQINFQILFTSLSIS